jgi:hypothetical protein
MFLYHDSGCYQTNANQSSLLNAPEWAKLKLGSLIKLDKSLGQRQ